MKKRKFTKRPNLIKMDVKSVKHTMRLIISFMLCLLISV